MLYKEGEGYELQSSFGLISILLGRLRAWKVGLEQSLRSGLYYTVKELGDFETTGDLGGK